MSYASAKHVTSKHVGTAPIVTPRVSEKAYAQSQHNVYLFNVPLSLNKQQIAHAVTEQFNVTVTGVKTLVQNGKAVRFNRGKRHNPGTTVRSDFKKAYVTLAEGSSIAVFNEQETGPSNVKDEEAK